MNRLRMVIYLMMIAASYTAAWKLYALPESYREDGRQEVRTEFAKKSAALLAERNAEIKAVNNANALNLKEAIKTHEIETEKLNGRYLAARDDGLRWKTATNSNANPRSTEATCSCGIAGAGENRLPDKIEDGLFSLAREADRITLKLTMLQRMVTASECFIAD